MIPSGVKVFLASHPVDFRKGPDSLLSLVRDAGSDPFNGALYVFRAKRADRVKIVWWDGSGVCLYAKRLEKSQFCWPRVILPVLTGFDCRIHAAIFSFWAGVTPPMPMLGRS
ncbi:IS66 family insertion sequence element accessory protein TnpB [Sinorhizobium fredii]|uniref:IS66 family insertion sequence element accessory protein TnpB n=2 Tax=Rhizobium fredii TaxID=380 RepID=UPI000BAC8E85